jgi:hypothetical protein
MQITKQSFAEGRSIGRAPEESGSLTEALQEIADDLGARSAITAPDAVDLATAITLVNAIKAALNTAVKTTRG